MGKPTPNEGAIMNALEWGYDKAVNGGFPEPIQPRNSSPPT